MKKIKCPNCGEEFQPSRSGYDNILKQVRDQEFQQEIEAYKAALDSEKESAVKKQPFEQKRNLENLLTN